jgi:hypothetical protein
LCNKALYSQFDGVDPSRTVKMIQAEKTPELMQYMEKISGVVEYENQRFLLFFGYINLNNIFICLLQNSIKHKVKYHHLNDIEQ